MTNDHTSHIQHHPLLAGVPHEQVRDLVAATRIVRYVPGEELFTEGDDANGIFIIASGSVRVAARGGKDQVLLTKVSAPEILGEMGVLDGMPRSGTATAIDPCTVFFVPADRFLDLLEKSTLVTMRLLVILTERLRRTNGRLLELPAPPLVIGQSPQA